MNPPETNWKKDAEDGFRKCHAYFDSLCEWRYGNPRNEKNNRQA
jgi:hypothetical protein